MRKLTAIIQLSDENDYDGGDFEFGITNSDGTDLVKGNRKQGTLIIFPSFLSHRVAPITKGYRYSIITWMEGDTFV
jgi:PKHD-type hydroxylase